MVIMGLGWDTKNNKIRVPQTYIQSELPRQIFILFSSRPSMKLSHQYPKQK